MQFITFSQKKYASNPSPTCSLVQRSAWYTLSAYVPMLLYATSNLNLSHNEFDHT